MLNNCCCHYETLFLFVLCETLNSQHLVSCDEFLGEAMSTRLNRAAECSTAVEFAPELGSAMTCFTARAQMRSTR